MIRNPSRREADVDEKTLNNRPTRGLCTCAFGFLHVAGCRYWTASLLPALVGTTLPFWLKPPGFSFRWLGAIEFLTAAVLFHAGFSFLKAEFEDKFTPEWPKSRLLMTAITSIGVACLLGLHINSFLPGNIFIVYGLTTTFGGLLYVVPPFSLYQRVGGEVVLSESLGLLPVLGAYLVQTGDLTRTVYIASLPLVAVTALWVWTEELVSRVDDEKAGYKTMVILFGPRLSGRFVTCILLILIYATLILAVFTASIQPTSLIVLLSSVLALKVVTVSWIHYKNKSRMLEARKNAFMLHLVTCIIITASTLVALLH